MLFKKVYPRDYRRALGESEALAKVGLLTFAVVQSPTAVLLSGVSACRGMSCALPHALLVFLPLQVAVSERSPVTRPTPDPFF